MVNEKKENEPDAKVQKNNFSASVKKNPWMLSSLALGVVALILLFLVSSGGITGNAIGEKKVGENLINFIEAQQGAGSAEVVSVVKESGLYKVNVNVQGQLIPVFVSLDGKYAFAQPIPLTGDALLNAGSQQVEQPRDVPKSDKPKVELFVMSYCPYGTQMEKAILPVVSALKDKIDFKLRFTHFTLHGEKEDTEDFRQLCIREEQGTKLLPYIQCILNSTDPYAPADVNQCMKNTGIDTNKVDSCMKTKAVDYYAVDSELSQGYGVQGSPTLVINGVQASSARSPSSVLSTICSAFNNEPTECNSNLPTQSASPGFGYNTGSSADTAAVQCGF